MNADLQVVERLLGALSEMTVKGTVILAVAGVVTTWGMRRAAAATRHLVWSTAVAAVLALPLIGTMAPQWSVPVMRRIPFELWGKPSATPKAALTAPVALAPIRASQSSPTGELQARIEGLSAEAERLANAITARAAATDVSSEPTRNVATLPSLNETLENPSATSASGVAMTGNAPATIGANGIALLRNSSPMTWLAIVWAAGALFILGRLLLGTLSLWRIGRSACATDNAAWLSLLQSLRRGLGIRRPVTLLVGGADAVPMTWGTLYPVVLLPSDAMSWSEDRRRAVLLHELAHVERFDMLTHLMSQLALAALWFHPLAILASRRLRAERERACDDLVLAAGGIRATAYADDLLTLVRTLGQSRAMSAGLAMARRSDFEGRLLSILDPTAPRVRTDRRRTMIAALLVAIAVVPLAGLRSAEASESHPLLQPLVGPLSASAEGALFRGDGLWNSRTAPAPVAVPAPAMRTKPVADTSNANTAIANTSLPKERAMAPAQFGVHMSSSTSLVAPSVSIRVPAMSPRLNALPALNAPKERIPQEALPAEVIADLARAVSGMTSDSDKSAVLLKLSSRAGETAEVRKAFFGSVQSMVTCSDKRRVLVPVVARFGDDTTLAAVLDAVRTMTTDSERATVLAAVAGKNKLTAPMVRERFFSVLEGVTSESSRASVLLAAITAERENTAVHRAVIASSGRITSESTRASLLLALATSTNALRDPDTRARFIDTLGKITSSSQYRRVMDAVVK